MTRETLERYQAIRKELRQLTRLLRSPEAKLIADTEKGQQLLALYEEKREALIATQEQIEQAIDSLSPTERTILRMRYIEGRSWTAISLDVYYSRQQAFRIAEKAIQKLEKL